MGWWRESAGPVGLSSGCPLSVAGVDFDRPAAAGGGALRFDRGLSFTVGARISFAVDQRICTPDVATATRCAVEGSSLVTQATRAEPDPSDGRLPCGQPWLRLSLSVCERTHLTYCVALRIVYSTRASVGQLAWPSVENNLTHVDSTSHRLPSGDWCPCGGLVDCNCEG